ncbi:MAG: electron transport complex subunit RsxE [Vulcanimicrobiota bacterium]
MKEFINIIKNGLWEENGVFTLALGLCPALAVTTDANNGLGMGLALIFVLTMSVTIASIVRNFISPRVRIPVFLAIISGFVTITDLILQAYFPDLSKALGIFVALIVVNCLVLGRVEVFASKNPPHKAFADGIGMGIGFTIALVIIGGIREILGAGKLFGHAILPASFKPVSIMILSPGGFITIGILMGIIAWYKNRTSLSGIAQAKGVSQEKMVPEEAPDEIKHYDKKEKPE